MRGDDILQGCCLSFGGLCRNGSMPKITFGFFVPKKCQTASRGSLAQLRAKSRQQKLQFENDGTS